MLREDSSLSYITVVQDFFITSQQGPWEHYTATEEETNIVRNRIIGKESISQLKVLLHIQRVRGSIIDDVLKIVFVMGYHPNQWCQKGKINWCASEWQLGGKKTLFLTRHLCSIDDVAKNKSIREWKDSQFQRGKRIDRVGYNLIGTYLFFYLIIFKLNR